MYWRTGNTVSIVPREGPQLTGEYPSFQEAKKAVQELDELQTKYWTVEEWEDWFYRSGGYVIEKLIEEEDYV